MKSDMNKSSIDSSCKRIERKRRLSKKERKALKKKIRQDKKPVVSKEEKEEEAFYWLEKYTPIELPLKPSEELSKLGEIDRSEVRKRDVDGEGGENEKSLGKWFPNALLIKCAVNYTNTGKLLIGDSSINEDDVSVVKPKASLLLFYQYTRNGKWSQEQLKLLITYLSKVAKIRHVGGRIRVSQEGVNATISAVDLKHVTARETLRFIAEDLRNFDSNVFTTETDFKYIDDLKPDRHFKELKIIPVQELVFYGFKDEEAPISEKGGTHLDAEKYHEMLKKDNTVVIDVRNHYEAIIGRFDGQQKKCRKDDGTEHGAEYLDPKMRKSTDFKSWLETPETQQKLENKTVL